MGATPRSEHPHKDGDADDGEELPGDNPTDSAGEENESEEESSEGDDEQE